MCLWNLYHSLHFFIFNNCLFIWYIFNTRISLNWKHILRILEYWRSSSSIETWSLSHLRQNRLNRLNSLDSLNSLDRFKSLESLERGIKWCLTISYRSLNLTTLCFLPSSKLWWWWLRFVAHDSTRYSNR